MRRSLAFVTRHRSAPDRPILRLFRFDDRQAQFVDRALQGVVASGATTQRAHELLDRVLIAFLEGREPSGEVSRGVRLGRSLFPVLTDAEIERLPRAGAPACRIMVLVFQIEHTKPDGTRADRTVRLGMTREQVNVYNAALASFQKMMRATRDDAWHTTNTVVGRLLNGAVLTETADENMRALAAVFKPQPLHELPDATEDDVRNWAFTCAPLLSVVSS